MVVHHSGDLGRLVLNKVVTRGLHRSSDEVISEARQVLDERDQDLDARAMAFKANIEARLRNGPATPMDFSALKRQIHEEVEARQGSRS